MGWWKVQGTEKIIGDGPLEALEEAVVVVLDEYQATFGRKPTKGEWESLLRAVLASTSTDDRVTDDGIVEKVHIELK